MLLDLALLILGDRRGGAGRARDVVRAGTRGGSTTSSSRAFPSIHGGAAIRAIRARLDRRRRCPPRPHRRHGSRGPPVPTARGHRPARGRRIGGSNGCERDDQQPLDGMNGSCVSTSSSGNPGASRRAPPGRRRDARSAGRRRRSPSRARRGGWPGAPRRPVRERSPRPSRPRGSRRRRTPRVRKPTAYADERDQSIRSGSAQRPGSGRNPGDGPERAPEDPPSRVGARDRGIFSRRNPRSSSQAFTANFDGGGGPTVIPNDDDVDAGARRVHERRDRLV